ncbi:MAG: NADH-quinone oxidoreductase subunit J [Phycisphaerales bacterium]
MTLAQQADALSGIEPWLFYPFALLAVIGALGVVLSPQIVRMAVYLLFTLAGVAFLYLFLAAEFLAVIQLIVYVGGVLILIIFGVMLTSKNPFLKQVVPFGQRIAGWLIGLSALLIMGWLGTLVADGAPSGASLSSGPARYGVTELGVSLLGRYVLPFEIAAVLLLVVMIGAAYMAKGRRVDLEDDAPTRTKGTAE